MHESANLMAGHRMNTEKLRGTGEEMVTSGKPRGASVIAHPGSVLLT